MAETGIILCDSNILIRLFRKDILVKEQLDGIAFDNLAISIITKAELLAGANKQNYSRTLEILEMFHLIHFDLKSSLEFDKLIANKRLFNAGSQIPDVLIAATAIAHHMSLFTDNKKHFKDIPGLVLYNI